MQFEFNFTPPRNAPPSDSLLVKGRPVPVKFVRNLRARRYVLRLERDGSARVTVPRGGSLAEARGFAERSKAWLERQLERAASRADCKKEWSLGTQIFFRGELVPIEEAGPGMIRLGGELLRIRESANDFRRMIECHLWGLAAVELPEKVLAFAAKHQFRVQRISIRNQRSRWGSCSRRGTISLNWRLIQTPIYVQDYLVLHELCHLLEMNHSARFWTTVERFCPDYRVAERWLKQHSRFII